MDSSAIPRSLGKAQRPQIADSSEVGSIPPLLPQKRDQNQTQNQAQSSKNSSRRLRLASTCRLPPSHSSLPRWTGVFHRRLRKATRFPKDTALDSLPHGYKRAKGELRRGFQRGQSQNEEIEGRDAPHRIIQRDEKVHLHGAHIAARKRVKRQIREHYG